MTAPPPMPNSPASNPVMTPPTTMASASQSSSLNGTPRIICLSFRGRAQRGTRNPYPRTLQNILRSAFQIDWGYGFPARRFAAPGNDELRGDVRQFPVAVQDLVRNERERCGEEFGAGLRGSRGAGEMPAVSARTGHGAEQTVQMSRDGVQPRAVRDFTFDIRGERGSGLFRRVERSVLTEHQRIDRDQPPRLLIGGAPHHDAVDVL